MKSAIQIPELLTLLSPVPGQYVIRVGDLKYRPIAVALSKMLDDLSSLILVTPADTKVFKVSQNGANPASMPIDPEPVADEPGVDVELDAETLAAIKAQEAHALPNAEPEEATTAEEPVAPKTRRRKPIESSAAGRTETCGRCRGSGEVRSFAGDQPITAKCPICHGEGTAIRYGAKR